jgi:hypothetical protein
VIYHVALREIEGDRERKMLRKGSENREALRAAQGRRCNSAGTRRNVYRN